MRASGDGRRPVRLPVGIIHYVEAVDVPKVGIPGDELGAGVPNDAGDEDVEVVDGFAVRSQLAFDLDGLAGALLGEREVFEPLEFPRQGVDVVAPAIGETVSR